MEIVLLFGGLVGLWIAARVGYRRRLARWNGNPLVPKPDPLQPGLEEIGVFLLVLGTIGCALSVAQFFSPDFTRATGGSSWLWNAVYDTLGTRGVATIWLGGGVMLIAMGITALRR